VVATTTRQLSGSVAIDEWHEGAEPHAPRWDYLVGFNADLHWVEVHGATASEVSTVLAKLDWLLDRIEGWPRLGARRQSFHWIATGSIQIPKQSRQYRQAAARGLRPKKQLRLS
jgi:hypothetical protein